MKRKLSEHERSKEVQKETKYDLRRIRLRILL